MTTKEREFAYLTQNPELCLESPMEAAVYRTLKTIGIVPVLQFPLGPFWADFAFPDKKIAIEYDGKIHETKVEQDKARDEYFEKEGWKVYRLTSWYFERTKNPNYLVEDEEPKNRLEEWAEKLKDELRADRKGDFTQL